MVCKNEQICKFNRATPCELVFICKFAENEMEIPETPKPKRGRGRPREKHPKKPKGHPFTYPKFSMDRRGIEAARALLKERKRDGLLNENQILALDQHSYKQYNMLEEVEKRQILDVVKDSNKSVVPKL